MDIELSQQQLNEFFDVGFLLLKGVFKPSEVEKLIPAFENLYELSKTMTQTNITNGSQFVFENQNLHRVVWCGANAPELLKISEDQRILKPVKQILNSSEFEHLINQIHFKMPGDNVEFPWHQDSQHRGYGSADWQDVNGKGSYVQTLMAIDPIRRNNGPVQFIPYSGRLGHLDIDKKGFPKEFNISDAISPEMDPGDVIFFGPYTIHGSSPNTSGKPRRVLINGYAFPGANKRKYPGDSVRSLKAS